MAVLLEHLMPRCVTAILVSLAFGLPGLSDDQIPKSVQKRIDEANLRNVDFVFVRIKYDELPRGARPTVSWPVDYPDADREISKHLGNVTPLRINPKGKVLRLTDDSLSRHPFIYMASPARIHLSNDEVKSLRSYLLGGGFLMVDDLWGETELKGLSRELKRVFPDLQPVDIPLNHAIFNCAFQLQEKPQVPSISSFLSGDFQRQRQPKANYQAIYNDNGKMMILICHNTDLGDGWERASDSAEYAQRFSFPLAFQMGTNAVVYALTQAGSSDE